MNVVIWQKKYIYQILLSMFSFQQMLSFPLSWNLRNGLRIKMAFKNLPFKKTLRTSTWRSFQALSKSQTTMTKLRIIFLKNSSAKKFEKWNLASYYSLKKMWLCTFSKGQMGIHSIERKAVPFVEFTEWTFFVSVGFFYLLATSCLFAPGCKISDIK